MAKGYSGGTDANQWCRASRAIAQTKWPVIPAQPWEAATRPGSRINNGETVQCIQKEGADIMSCIKVPKIKSYVPEINTSAVVCSRQPTG